jgi:transketolase
LCQALVARAAQHENMVFLTGDLGFMALEPLQAAMGARFVNCGVAEQNMMGVAAGLAHEGLEAWTYTIAPFCYARAFEQIRNDICMHRLPVKLLANGGGYGYGVMGATHHALEDYGVLLTLPGMIIFAPAFDEDVASVIATAGTCEAPAYIRLGRGEAPAGASIPAYAPWRCLLAGSRGILVAVGPLAGSAWAVLRDMPQDARPALWAMCELRAGTAPPDELVRALRQTPRLAVIEEHVAHGGVGSMLCLWAASAGISLEKFAHLHASNAPRETYGSQLFMRKQAGLDPATIAQVAASFAHVPA